MANELIRPIDPDTARAIEEVAKTAGKGLDLAGQAGGYAASIVGRTPGDFIGFVFGDRLFHWRVRQLAALQQKTNEILLKRAVADPEQNPSIEVPLLEAAIDESREELVSLWAKLWAAAMDPQRKAVVRRSLIDVVKKMEPIDAAIFATILSDPQAFGGIGEPGKISAGLRKHGFSYPDDETRVSIEALVGLNLISSNIHLNAQATSLGKTLWRAIED